MNAHPAYAPAAAVALSEPKLLEVENLTVTMPGDGDPIRIVDGISFSIGTRERVALVGESGSGKSVTAQALMRLNPRARIDGRIMMDGVDLAALSDRAINAYRGSRIGMVFQDPMSSLDPLMTIGEQVAEVLRIRGVGRAEARAKAKAVLEELGVARAAERLDAYPHEFSGGMRQRVVLAMALVAEPKLLIADEPTTALDVRVQQQVLDVLDEASMRRGLSVLLITHDLGIVAGFADRVMVMYSGRIVEDAPVEQIFAAPQHPYTKGLLAAIPRVDRTLDRLVSIPGAPPPPRLRPAGCAFHPRCPAAFGPCAEQEPALLPIGGSRVACHLVASSGGAR